MKIKDLEPKALWSNFADLNAVPRPSKKEEKVIEFMLNFGKSLNLETFQDSIGNLIIKKPASKWLFFSRIWIWFTKKTEILFLISIHRELK